MLQTTGPVKVVKLRASEQHRVTVTPPPPLSSFFLLLLLSVCIDTRRQGGACSGMGGRTPETAYLVSPFNSYIFDGILGGAVRTSARLCKEHLGGGGAGLGKSGLFEPQTFEKRTLSQAGLH